VLEGELDKLGLVFWGLATGKRTKEFQNLIWRGEQRYPLLRRVNIIIVGT